MSAIEASMGNDETALVTLLRKHRCICYYPSSGTDLSDIDFFGSGKLLWEERRQGHWAEHDLNQSTPAQAPSAPPAADPDLFFHTDVNFYQEFASGFDELAHEHGIHGQFEILSVRELPALQLANLVYETYEHTGRCFEYTFRAWGSPHVKTLIYCLCENELVVAKILLAHAVTIPIIWSRNWAGGKTHGTWLANVLDRLHTSRVYTDWLCVPGKRGEPRNPLVEKAYPELMQPAKVSLVRNNDLHWIDEGANGWVEEFLVTPHEPS